MLILDTNNLIFSPNFKYTTILLTISVVPSSTTQEEILDTYERKVLSKTTATQPKHENMG